jgi:exodeoxyribonuclease-3
MIIATWNVNSITVRLDQVLSWLNANRPDVLCLQETKTIDDKFPRDAFASLGYMSVCHGEKTYNGVAILSKLPIENVVRGFSHEGASDSKRMISASVGGLKILNTYIPNGQMVGSEKFEYKLKWISLLGAHIADNFSAADKLLWCGDFNIAPQDQDIYDAQAWNGQIMASATERKALEDLRLWGFTDAFRQHNKENGQFSWWDYRQGAFRRNMGFRIDHIYVTESLAKISKRTWIDKEPRKHERPSDHAPVLIEVGK